MATAKRKQEELGEECDDNEAHDNDPCSDDDDAKRPRLDLHHQHIHHQLPHHRQWSALPVAATETIKHKFDGFDACNDSEKDSKDLDLDDVHSASTKSEECDDKGPYLTVPYSRSYETYDGYDATKVNNYYNGFYPEYLVPRTFCKDTEDVPCDLSNWQRVNRFDQRDHIDNHDRLDNRDQFDNHDHHDVCNQREICDRNNSDQIDHNTTEPRESDNTDQPINFAYYHF